jgi:prevent-host-death family protein
MVKQVNLYEAKTQLSRLVEEAAAGQEIVIAKNGKPMARLVPPEPAKTGKRVGGQWGKYLTPEERADFGSDDWLRRWKEADEEILRDFKVLNDPGKEWRDTSSTPTSSSRSNSSRKRSGAKRAKR